MPTPLLPSCKLPKQMPCTAGRWWQRKAGLRVGPRRLPGDVRASGEARVAQNDSTAFMQGANGMARHTVGAACQVNCFYKMQMADATRSATCEFSADDAVVPSTMR